MWAFSIKKKISSLMICLPLAFLMFWATGKNPGIEKNILNEHPGFLWRPSQSWNLVLMYSSMSLYRVVEHRLIEVWLYIGLSKRFTKILFNRISFFLDSKIHDSTNHRVRALFNLSLRKPGTGLKTFYYEPHAEPIHMSFETNVCAKTL